MLWLNRLNRNIRFAFLVLVLLTAGSALYGQAPKVAVLVSDIQAAEYFRLHYPVSVFGYCQAPSYYLGQDEYQRYYRGWTYVLQTRGIPYDLIKDADLNPSALGRFKVLILSNTPRISQDQEKAISQWVAKGGRLLATFGSGYKDIIDDPRGIEVSGKLQEGGTNGLHNLWHDPLSKVVTSFALAVPGVPETQGVDVTITDSEGPTAGIPAGLLPGYGALANMLVQRPDNAPGTLAYIQFRDPIDWKRPQPAILSTKHAKGLVVYYAFAPEYIVVKEFGLTACDVGLKGPWAGRSAALVPLMVSTINYLRSN